MQDRRQEARRPAHKLVGCTREQIEKPLLIPRIDRKELMSVMLLDSLTVTYPAVSRTKAASRQPCAADFALQSRAPSIAI